MDDRNIETLHREIFENNCQRLYYGEENFYQLK
jgi:hypothetical protein